MKDKDSTIEISKQLKYFITVCKENTNSIQEFTPDQKEIMLEKLDIFLESFEIDWLNITSLFHTSAKVGILNEIGINETNQKLTNLQLKVFQKISCRAINELNKANKQDSNINEA